MKDDTVVVLHKWGRGNSARADYTALPVRYVQGAAGASRFLSLTYIPCSRRAVWCFVWFDWFHFALLLFVRISAAPAQTGGKGKPGGTATPICATAEPVGEVQYGHPTAGYASAAPVNVATPLDANK